MKNVFRYLLSVCCLIAIVFSCTEDIDPDQLDDLEVTPALEASLLYVEATEQIINVVTGNTVFSKDFSFDAYGYDLFSERVIEGTVTYVVENTTSKELEINVAYLDESDAVLDAEVFSVGPAPTPILQREIVYGQTGRPIDIIKNLSSIRVRAVNLSDQISTSSVSEPMLSLKSTSKFTVRLK